MEKYNNPTSNGNSDSKKEIPNNLFQRGNENPFAGLNMNIDPGTDPKQVLGNSLNFMMNNNPLMQNDNSISYEDHNLNYYQEYCRLFIANVVLTTQMKELVTEKNELFSKLEHLEKKTDEYNMKLNESMNDRKKRMRRTAEEIDRHFKCNIDSCAKTYGSEGSLNQHIKLKHPDHYALMAQNLINNSHNSNDILSKNREDDDEEEEEKDEND